MPSSKGKTVSLGSLQKIGCLSLSPWSVTYPVGNSFISSLCVFLEKETYTYILLFLLSHTKAPPCIRHSAARFFTLIAYPGDHLFAIYRKLHFSLYHHSTPLHGICHKVTFIEVYTFKRSFWIFHGSDYFLCPLLPFSYFSEKSLLVCIWWPAIEDLFEWFL